MKIEIHAFYQNKKHEIKNWLKRKQTSTTLLSKLKLAFVMEVLNVTR